jgi:hypothetical protein
MRAHLNLQNSYKYTRRTGTALLFVIQAHALAMSPQPTPSVPSVAITQKQESSDAHWHSLCNKGRNLLLQQNFGEAWNVFEQISQQSESPKTQLLGLYGKGVMIYHGHGRPRNLVAAKEFLMPVANAHTQFNAITISEDIRTLARFFVGTILY